jgi:iron(III) transport system ATP-binding protein
MSAAIQLEGVTVLRDGRPVLENVSLGVLPGETLSVLGSSGSGKTTLLRIIAGLLAPDLGAVRIGDALAGEGRRIILPPAERGIAMVFQDLALWPHLTVAGNLDFGLVSRGLPHSARGERIHQMLSRVGLQEQAHRYPGELSGGERQRVAIARALVLEPRAVLLDEPLSNLDAPLKRELIALLVQLLKERHVPGLYVTHELREAAALGDRIAILEAGRVVQEGSLQELRAAPATPFVRDLTADSSS